MSYTLNYVDANGVLQMVAHADNGDWDGNKTSLVNVTIGSAVAELPVGCFLDATNLTSVTFNSTNLTQIQSLAFHGCTSLVSIVIPEGVEYLQDRCFKNCQSLISVTIPSSMLGIAGHTFLNCTSLTTITNLSSIDLTLLMGFTQSQLDSVNTSASSGDPFVTPMLQ